MSAALQDGFRVLSAIFTQDEIARLRQAIADSIDRVARVMLTPFAASLPSAPIEAGRAGGPCLRLGIAAGRHGGCAAGSTRGRDRHASVTERINRHTAGTGSPDRPRHSHPRGHTRIQITDKSMAPGRAAATIGHRLRHRSGRLLDSAVGR
jgi:hypothetical protein